MKKKPAAKAPKTGASVIEKKVPTTKIERTVKVTIKGTEFELSFEEANKLSDEIRKITGADKAADELANRLREAMKRKHTDDYDEPLTPKRPYEPPFRPRPGDYPRPWYFDQPRY